MDLTLLIYFVYLLGALNFTAGIVMTLTFIVSLVWFFGALMSDSETELFKKDKSKPAMTFFFKHLKKLAIIFCTALTISVVVPSERFVILMAASEVGKQIAQTDVAKDSIDLLNVWIQRERDKIMQSLTKSN